MANSNPKKVKFYAVGHAVEAVDANGRFIRVFSLTTRNAVPKIEKWLTANGYSTDAIRDGRVWC